MISSGIKLSQNRFAVLSKNPDFDSKTLKKSKEQNESNSVSYNHSKGNKKSDQFNNSAPKQLHKQKRKDYSKGGKKRTMSGSLPSNDDWERKDQELVEKLFHDDMCEAIALSKQEFEKQQQTKKEQKLAAKSKNSFGSNVGQKKNDGELHKEKKLKSSKAVSLKEFHQHVEKSLPLKNESTAKSHSPETSKRKTIKTVNGGGDYFEHIDKEVIQIEHKERKNGKKRNTNETLATVFKEPTAEKLSEKDKEIEKLEDELQTWKDKFQHVKKRNKQLLVMLQQGEMKEKAELLLEVERLSVIRDELTDDIKELNESLEKERSKVSKLKDELQNAARNKKS